MALERLISADDHLDLSAFPPTIFSDRVESKYHDLIPKVVEDKELGQVWKLYGKFVDTSGRRRPGQSTKEHVGFKPGIPSERLKDMDRDDVIAQVIYGPPAGFKFINDEEARLACQRAFNDYTADFNAFDPNRLLALAMLPGHNPDVAKAELLRAAARGHRGAVLPLYESDDAVFRPSWESFWAAANDAGMILHFHLAGGSSILKPVMESWEFGAYTSVIPMQMDEPLAGMIYSGIFERYPNVRLVMGESGLGWIPYLIKRMDHEFKKYNSKSKDVKLSRLPSELFHDHVFVTYEEDDVGLAFLDTIGVDNVMWASDYPHGDTTWPDSRQAILSSPLGKLSKEVQDKIVYGNAARLYNIGK